MLSGQSSRSASLESNNFCVIITVSLCLSTLSYPLFSVSLSSIAVNFSSRLFSMYVVHSRGISAHCYLRLPLRNSAELNF